MATGKMSRRLVVGVLGAGALAVPLRAAHAAGEIAVPASTRPLPLVSGERIARWIIADVEPLRRGAVGVVVHTVNAEYHRFRLEILARDRSPAAVRPPAETEHFAIFVENGGDGWSPTVEEQGLAAMTLAARIARIESPEHSHGFLTHAARLAQHTASLVAGG